MLRFIVVFLLTLFVSSAANAAELFSPVDCQKCTSEAYRERLATIVAEETMATNTDPAEVWAIISKETTFNHYGKGGKVKHGDGGRSIGLGQLNRGWGRKFDLNLYDLRQNVRGTCKLIEISRDEYHYDLEKRFAWYNGGGRGMRCKAAKRYAKDACNRYERYSREYHAWAEVQARVAGNMVGLGVIGSVSKVLPVLE